MNIRRVVASILLVSFLVTSSDAAFALAPSGRIEDKNFQQAYTALDSNTRALDAIGESLYLKMPVAGVRELVRRRAGVSVPLSVDRVQDGAVYFSFKLPDGSVKYFRCLRSDDENIPSSATKLLLPGGRPYWKEELLSPAIEAIEKEVLASAMEFTRSILAPYRDIASQELDRLAGILDKENAFERAALRNVLRNHFSCLMYSSYLSVILIHLNKELNLNIDVEFIGYPGRDGKQLGHICLRSVKSGIIIDPYPEESSFRELSNQPSGGSVVLLGSELYDKHYRHFTRIDDKMVDGLVTAIAPPLVGALQLSQPAQRDFFSGLSKDTDTFGPHSLGAAEAGKGDPFRKYEVGTYADIDKDGGIAQPGYSMVTGRRSVPASLPKPLADQARSEILVTVLGFVMGLLTSAAVLGYPAIIDSSVIGSFRHIKFWLTTIVAISTIIAINLFFSKKAIESSQKLYKWIESILFAMHKKEVLDNKNTIGLLENVLYNNSEFSQKAMVRKLCANRSALINILNNPTFRMISRIFEAAGADFTNKQIRAIRDQAIKVVEMVKTVDPFYFSSEKNPKTVLITLKLVRAIALSITKKMSALFLLRHFRKMADSDTERYLASLGIGPEAWAESKTMLLIRDRIKAAIAEAVASNSPCYVYITGDSKVGKTTFMRLMEDADLDEGRGRIAFINMDKVYEDNDKDMEMSGDVLLGTITRDMAGKGKRLFIVDGRDAHLLSNGNDPRNIFIHITADEETRLENIIRTDFGVSALSSSSQVPDNAITLNLSRGSRPREAEIYSVFSGNPVVHFPKFMKAMIAAWITCGLMLTDVLSAPSLYISATVSVILYVMYLAITDGAGSALNDMLKKAMAHKIIGGSGDAVTKDTHDTFGPHSLGAAEAGKGDPFKEYEIGAYGQDGDAEGHGKSGDFNNVVQNYEELARAVKGLSAHDKKTIVVAAAADDQALISLDELLKDGVANVILVGDQAGISDISARHKLENIRKVFSSDSVVNEPDNAAAVAKAIDIIKDGRGHVLMKGHVDTNTFLSLAIKALRIQGTEAGHIYPASIQGRKLLVITDAAFSNHKDDIAITKSAVEFSRGLGIDEPEVASPKYPARESVTYVLKHKISGRTLILTTDSLARKAQDEAGMRPLASIARESILRTVRLAKSRYGIASPNVACVEASEIIKPRVPFGYIPQELKIVMADDITREGFAVGGPFGLDLAISEEAAKIKGSKDPVAGKADILYLHDSYAAEAVAAIFAHFANGQVYMISDDGAEHSLSKESLTLPFGPNTDILASHDVASMNVIGKALTHITDSPIKIAGAVLGASVPFIVPSRGETAREKYYSACLALYYLSIGGVRSEGTTSAFDPRLEPRGDGMDVPVEWEERAARIYEERAKVLADVVRMDLMFTAYQEILSDRGKGFWKNVVMMKDEFTKGDYSRIEEARSVIARMPDPQHIGISEEDPDNWINWFDLKDINARHRPLGYGCRRPCQHCLAGNGVFLAHNLPLPVAMKAVYPHNFSNWKNNELFDWNDPFFGVGIDGLIEYFARTCKTASFSITTAGWPKKDKRAQEAAERISQIEINPLYGTSGFSVSFHLAQPYLDITRSIYEHVKNGGSPIDPTNEELRTLAAPYVEHYANILRTLNPHLRHIYLAYTRKPSLYNLILTYTLKQVARQIEIPGIDELNISRSIENVLPDDNRDFLVYQDLHDIQSEETIGRSLDFLKRLNLAEKGDPVCLKVEAGAITDRAAPKTNYPMVSIAHNGDVVVNSHVDGRVLARTSIDADFKPGLDPRLEPRGGEMDVPYEKEMQMARIAAAWPRENPGPYPENPYGTEGNIRRNFSDIDGQYLHDISDELSDRTDPYHSKKQKGLPVKMLVIGVGRGLEVFQLMGSYTNKIEITSTSKEDLVYRTPEELMNNFSGHLTREEAQVYIDRLRQRYLRCDLDDGIQAEDGYFDVVIIDEFTLGYVKDKYHAIREMLRVCKNGGVVYCSPKFASILDKEADLTFGEYFANLKHPEVDSLVMEDWGRIPRENRTSNWLKITKRTGISLPELELIRMEPVSISLSGKAITMPIWRTYYKPIPSPVSPTDEDRAEKLHTYRQMIGALQDRDENRFNELALVQDELHGGEMSQDGKSTGVITDLYGIRDPKSGVSLGYEARELMDLLARSKYGFDQDSLEWFEKHVFGGYKFSELEKSDGIANGGAANAVKSIWRKIAVSAILRKAFSDAGFDVDRMALKRSLGAHVPRGERIKNCIARIKALSVNGKVEIVSGLYAEPTPENTEMWPIKKAVAAAKTEQVVQINAVLRARSKAVNSRTPKIKTPASRVPEFKGDAGDFPEEELERHMQPAFMKSDDISEEGTVQTQVEPAIAKASSTLYSRLRLARNRYLLRVNEERLAVLKMKTVSIRYYRGDEYSYKKLPFSEVNPIAYSRRAASLMLTIKSLKKRIEADLPDTDNGDGPESTASQASPLEPSRNVEGAPATLLLEMHAGGVYSNNSKTMNELCAVASKKRTTGKSYNTISNERKILERAELLFGGRKGYYLPGWLKNIKDIRGLIEDDPVLRSLRHAGLSDDEIGAVKERVRGLRADAGIRSERGSSGAIQNGTPVVSNGFIFAQVDPFLNEDMKDSVNLTEFDMPVRLDDNKRYRASLGSCIAIIIFDNNGKPVKMKHLQASTFNKDKLYIGKDDMLPGNRYLIIRGPLDAPGDQGGYILRLIEHLKRSGVAGSSICVYPEIQDDDLFRNLGFTIIAGRGRPVRIYKLFYEYDLSSKVITCIEVNSARPADGMVPEAEPKFVGRNSTDKPGERLFGSKSVAMVISGVPAQVVPYILREIKHPDIHESEVIVCPWNKNIIMVKLKYFIEMGLDYEFDGVFDLAKPVGEELIHQEIFHLPRYKIGLAFDEINRRLVFRSEVSNEEVVDRAIPGVVLREVVTSAPDPRLEPRGDEMDVPIEKEEQMARIAGDRVSPDRMAPGTPSKDIVRLRELIVEKKEQLAGKGIQRPVMLVIDGDSCTGKTCLSKNIAKEFCTYIIEGDSVVSDTKRILEKDPDYRNADPYAFWADNVNHKLGSICRQSNYELVILEGIYALGIVRHLEKEHEIVFDIMANVRADHYTRMRMLQAKRNKGTVPADLDSSEQVDEDTYLVDNKFLSDNVQEPYSFPVKYDIVIDNSDNNRTISGKFSDQVTNLPSPREPSRNNADDERPRLTGDTVTREGIFGPDKPAVPVAESGSAARDGAVDSVSQSGFKVLRDFSVIIHNYIPDPYALVPDADKAIDDLTDLAMQSLPYLKRSNILGIIVHAMYNAVGHGKIDGVSNIRGQALENADKLVIRILNQSKQPLPSKIANHSLYPNSNTPIFSESERDVSGGISGVGVDAIMRKFKKGIYAANVIIQEPPKVRWNQIQGKNGQPWEIAFELHIPKRINDIGQRGSTLEEDISQIRTKPAPAVKVIEPEVLPPEAMPSPVLAEDGVGNPLDIDGVSIQFLPKPDEKSYGLSQKELDILTPLLKTLANFRDGFNKNAGQDVIGFSVDRLGYVSNKYMLNITLKFAEEDFVMESIIVEGPSINGPFTVYGYYRESLSDHVSRIETASVQDLVSLETDVPKACVKTVETILTSIGMYPKDVTSLVEVGPRLLTSGVEAEAREVAQAETLASRIKMFASEAEKRSEGIVIGIETRSWMTDAQKTPVENIAHTIRSVVDEMVTRGIVSNVTVVVDDADGLAANIALAQEKIKAPLKNIVVLGDRNTLLSKKFDSFRDKSLLACLDPKDLEKLSYVRLFEMLNILLEVNFSGNDLDTCRALHKGFINIDFLKDASGTIISERLLLLIPDASAFDPDKPRDIYNLQTKKFEDQA